MKTSVYIVPIVCLLLGLGIGFILFDKNINTIRTEQRIVTHYDTITKIIERKPLKIRAIGKIKTTDTLPIATRPFVASLDTITENDTIHADYYFPANSFLLNINHRADTIPIVNKKIIVTSQESKIKYQNYIEVGSWIAAGLIIGILIK